jgi:hypothetical protein
MLLVPLTCKGAEKTENRMVLNTIAVWLDEESLQYVAEDGSELHVGVIEIWNLWPKVDEQCQDH